MAYRKRSRRSLPAMGAKSQAVVEGLLARVPGLELCEHDLDSFAMWIATRPGSLLCKFCYQAPQVLAENVTCASCGQAAGDPDKDAMVVAKVTDWHDCLRYAAATATMAVRRRGHLVESKDTSGKLLKSDAVKGLICNTAIRW